MALVAPPAVAGVSPGDGGGGAPRATPAIPPAASLRSGTGRRVTTPPGSKKAPTGWVSVPLHRGQEVVARCGGAWLPAVVMRPPRGRGPIGVVDTETWTERQVPMADIAVKATLACALRRSPKAAAQNAKAVAARIARVEQRMAKALAAAVASPLRTPLRGGGAAAAGASPPPPVGGAAQARRDAACEANTGAPLRAATSAASLIAATRTGPERGDASPSASPTASTLSASPEPSVVLKRNRCRPERAGLDARALRKVDEALHARVAKQEMPGVVNIVYRHGVLAHLDCHGYADLERKTPMRPDSIVRLYSMTKCIISVAVAICLEERLLELGDPVSKFIPAFAGIRVRREGGELEDAARPITLLHLLTHTAGMGYGPMLGDEADGETEERFIPLIERSGLGRTAPSDPKAITTLEQWCNAVASVPLRSQPGEEWFYSYSHDVVGRVVEVVTGQRLDAFLQKRILGPLGMVDTGFEVPREKWDRVAGMYRRFETTTVVDQAAAEKSVGAAPSPSGSDEQQTPSTMASSGGQTEAGGFGGSASPSSETATAATTSASPSAGESDGMDVDGQGHAAGDSAGSVDEKKAGTAEKESEQLDNTEYELKRLDAGVAEENEWMAGNACPILSGGGSVDAMTGGLVSTAADYARFCLMLLRQGELDGVRILRPETVQQLSSNQLPAATGKDDVWAFGTPGVGFGLIGSVSVAHPELDSALRPGEYGWGGMAGTAWTNDPREDFFLLSFSLTAFDLTTEEELRAGVRTAITHFDQRRERAELKRMERAEKEQRRLQKLMAAGAGAARTTSTATPTKGLRSPASVGRLRPSPSASEEQRSTKKRRTSGVPGATPEAKRSPAKTPPSTRPRP